MARIDKLIVTNLSILRSKYGKRWPRVRDGLRALVAADRRRGLATALIGLDDAAALRRHRLRPVPDPMDYPAHKQVVDSLWRALRPDYLVILGAIDVVPHQDLHNPTYEPGDDDDAVAWGDIPYACDAAYSRDPADFRAPTRVVGRVPDVTGGDDPRYLVRLLEIAAGYRCRARDDYQAHFGLSTLSWKDSTALSLRNLFGSDEALKTSPPGGPRWGDATIRRRAHFINCHGGVADPYFYGEDPKTEDQPYALSALFLAKGRRVADGTVIAAECCYGAELYDPREARGQMGICNTYLYRGAYGFFGSSTTAYGPPDGNGQADYICQYFLERVLRGASLGRAALEARQRFVQAAGVLDAYDLKTLAQFNLMGDPSIQAIGRAKDALGKSRVWKKVAAETRKRQAVARLGRREWIVRNSLLAAEATGATQRQRVAQVPARVKAALALAAREAGVRRLQFSSHAVVDPARRRIKARLGEKPSRAVVHVAVGSRKDGPARRTVALVATVENGRIVQMRRTESR